LYRPPLWPTSLPRLRPNFGGTTLSSVQFIRLRSQSALFYFILLPPPKQKIARPAFLRSWFTLVAFNHDAFAVDIGLVTTLSLSLDGITLILSAMWRALLTSAF
jgi:hypothetical protein